MDQMFQNINSVFLQITLNDQIFKKSQNFNMQISFSAEKQAGKAMYLGSDIVLWAKTDRNEILEEKLAMHNLAINSLWAAYPKHSLPVCGFWSVALWADELSEMHCGQNVDE